MLLTQPIMKEVIGLEDQFLGRDKDQFLVNQMDIVDPEYLLLIDQHLSADLLKPDKREEE
jgi:hypothetical protein